MGDLMAPIFVCSRRCLEWISVERSSAPPHTDRRAETGREWDRGWPVWCCVPIEANERRFGCGLWVSAINNIKDCHVVKIMRWLVLCYSSTGTGTSSALRIERIHTSTKLLLVENKFFFKKFIRFFFIVRLAGIFFYFVHCLHLPV